jgi:hypothetical protein
MGEEYRRSALRAQINTSLALGVEKTKKRKNEETKKRRNEKTNRQRSVVMLNRRPGRPCQIVPTPPPLPLR